MGIGELQETWAAGGSWADVDAEWRQDRERQLPELHALIEGFLSGSTSAADFRHEMDSFGKRTRYAGFAGISGQMFFNTLVNAATEEMLAGALRAAIPAPSDESECRRKFAEFLAFVDDARERAREVGVTLPSHGYTPYFVSFFWEAYERDRWPIYYPASRDILARHGLFVDKGPLAERYLNYREQIVRLREALDADTWAVENFLWQLDRETNVKAEPDGVKVSTVQPDDLYESFRSQDLIFPDEVITSLVLSLLTKPFVLLSGISGTGKTQLAVGLAAYLERRGTAEPVATTAPVGDDENAYVRLTEPRLNRGRTNLTREHQAVFALHGALPERGSYADFAVSLPNGTTGSMRLNNIGFADTARELYLLFFRSSMKEWLQEKAKPGDYLHVSFNEDGRVAAVDIAQPEQRPGNARFQRHQVLAVKSDWTDPRGLIGYENPLIGSYSDTELIRLLLRAGLDRENPYVVILDEMNLARVEYYFSDFLSAMELGGGTIALRPSTEGDVDEEVDDDVPAKLPLPENALFIGTVNVDETTFTFSPKVLDRANVLVFNDVDVQRFFERGGEPDATTFRLAGGSLDPADLADRSTAQAAALARARNFTPFSEALLELFALLEAHGRHFGYRVLSEITTFVGLALERVEGEEDAVWRIAFDLQLLQKVLPKLSGGRELEALFAELLMFCIDPSAKRDIEPAQVLDEARKRLRVNAAEPVSAQAAEPTDGSEPQPVSPPAYPRAARAVERMLTRLRQAGFVSYLE